MFAQTTRMRGGLMVAGNTFRNPGILAKIATTLDHVSHGRFELGMGSGHTEIEHRQYNIPYYTQGTRLRMLGESIQIVRSLLTNEKTTFEGKYYQMVDAYCEPKPVQRPLPFLVGGIGEDLTMRVVAKSADIWNFWESPSAEVYAQKLVALQRHCDEVGRDPSEIRKSVHIKPVIGETEAEVKERAPPSPAPVASRRASRLPSACSTSCAWGSATSSSCWTSRVTCARWSCWRPRSRRTYAKRAPVSSKTASAAARPFSRSTFACSEHRPAAPKKVNQKNKFIIDRRQSGTRMGANRIDEFGS